MNTQRIQKVVQLLDNTQNIRNISIIAHVDHGKTTLVDCLLASNNIVNRKQIGSIRFADSREDEREREITMKSSSFSLSFNQNNQDYLINLIDSPGHIAFRSEVSYALRLTDGALLLVDIVEGVSSQTYTVLKQAYQEKISCILVLNKMDRLINELMLSPLDAYKQILQTIDLGIKYQIKAEKETIEQLENKWFFSPEKGNVIFISAIHCWGFSVPSFNQFLKAKGQNYEDKHLWGEYYEHPKTKQIQNTPHNDKDVPIFVKHILKSLWQVYDTILNQDFEKFQKVCSVLKYKIGKNDQIDFVKKTNVIYQQVLNHWIPVENAILSGVCNLLPSPIQAQKYRLPIICNKLLKKNINIRQAIENCDQEAPCVIFISKMISINKRNFNEQGLNQYGDKNEERLIGFARIFSGTLKRGQKIFLIPQKNDQKLIQEVTLDNIYILMGQNLEGVKQVTAGNILALGNLENIVFKTGTLSTDQNCPQFTQMQLGAQQLLKVNLSTYNIQDMSKLTQGLKKLNQSDPSISIICQKNGEYQLATCGEMHLERCINDLEHSFANIKIKQSEPILQFKETIVYNNFKKINNFNLEQKKLVYENEDEDQDEKKEEKKEEILNIINIPVFYGKNNKINTKDIKLRQNIWQMVLPNQCFQITVRAIALPFEFAQYLEKYPSKDLNQKILEKLQNHIDQEYFQFIQQYFKAFGPQKNGPNLLLIKNIDEQTYQESHNISKQEIEQAFVNGFEQAVQQGPLAEEPLIGVCLIVENFEMVVNQVYDHQQDNFGSLSGQIMSSMISCSQESIMGAEPRLVEGVYLCEIQVECSLIGQIYSVLNKKKASDLQEELNEFSNLFSIKAKIPLSESIGFDVEVRDQTQSKAEYQLSFDSWKIIDLDPFYQPIKDEDVEEQGDKVDFNRSKQLIDKIRFRKGLIYNKKIVEDGHKNKTISKNK